MPKPTITLPKAPRPAMQCRLPVLASAGMFAADPVIYGLVDPAEPGHIRYVGKAKQPIVRLLGHLQGQVNRVRPSSRWIRALGAAGRTPDMVLIERVADGGDLGARECYWIHALRAAGHADLNRCLPKRVTAHD